ncbi:hypothetical protein V1477_019347 [Vespula maculifrons]|uniref:Uncharacterized protein n=1 Tax=Vespula maculifrons TaxID=7453 RepID=A0ABD2ASB5_VESMC
MEIALRHFRKSKDFYLCHHGRKSKRKIMDERNSRSVNDLTSLSPSHCTTIHLRLRYLPEFAIPTRPHLRIHLNIIVYDKPNTLIANNGHLSKITKVSLMYELCESIFFLIYIFFSNNNV